MIVQHFVVSPFQENTYVCHSRGEAVLIDPGTTTPAERQLVTDYVAEHDLTVKHLLLTHAHLDHIFGCAYFAERYGLDWRLHPKDAPLMDKAPLQAQMYGVALTPPPAPILDLEPGTTIAFGDAVWQIRHVPGHSPGSVAFVDEENGFAIGGDVLFQGSIGRTDLWQGDFETLLDSIRTQLFTLPEETVVYPGHGPATTVAREKATNPFLT